jgi:hypothetical protein
MGRRYVGPEKERPTLMSNTLPGETAMSSLGRALGLPPDDRASVVRRSAMRLTRPQRHSGTSESNALCGELAGGQHSPLRAAPKSKAPGGFPPGALLERDQTIWIYQLR